MFFKGLKTLAFTKYVWACFEAFIFCHWDGVPDDYLVGLLLPFRDAEAHSYGLLFSGLSHLFCSLHCH